VRLYCLAGARNDPESRYNLAILYEKGDGVPEDRNEAVRLLGLAADQGYPVAQTALARLQSQKAS